MIAANIALAPPRAQRTVSMQSAGRALVVGGFFVTIGGVVAYCSACLAGGLDSDFGDLLMKNAVPFGRSTLAALGLGTLMWIVGSFTYLRGEMNVDA